ncbi:MAG: hypothetical protein N2515_01650 [Deltaproteobacteria bacterium]|nr:hypothetical protein [Deltaproteobacteria bacterium]
MVRDQRRGGITTEHAKDSLVWLDQSLWLADPIPWWVREGELGGYLLVAWLLPMQGLGDPTGLQWG